MNNRILIIFFLLFCTHSYGRDIDVGVYRGNTIYQIDFSYNKGKYLIYGDSVLFDTLSLNSVVSLTQKGKMVELKIGILPLGNHKEVRLVPLTENNSLKLRPQRPLLKQRYYKDGFKVVSGSSGLTIINNASYSHYLGGVIESEGGKGQPLEYYKAQAVISRTYALMHEGRHLKEGFDLCDQVHCQVYSNQLTYSEDIRKAVEATNDLCVVDSTGQLIQTFFFSNCGGETVSSDYVWRVKLPYLESVRDTFCTSSLNAKWEKRIPKQEWKDFLVKKFYYPIKDPQYRNTIFTFDQHHRKVFFVSPLLGIPLFEIRNKFKLKSTYFSAYPEGDYVVLKGRGFGHGVGLCQEGAMKMAKSGYTFVQILSYYYRHIEIVPFTQQLFYKQKNVLDWRLY